MARINNKKAIYLTLISIMLLSLFVIFFNINSKLSFTDVDKLKADRVKQVNRLINDVRVDAERSLNIAGFRTVLGMNEYIKKYHSDGIDTNDEDVVKEKFKDIIIDGIIDTYALEVMQEEAGKFVTLDRWVEELKDNVLDDLGITLIVEGHPAPPYVSAGELEIGYNNPFELSIKWTTTFILEDDSSNLKWRLENEVIETALSIEGFFDPLYIIGSNYVTGPYTNKITKSEYSTFSDPDGLLMEDEFKDHLRTQSYIASISAPSFFQRFMDPTNYGLQTSTNGIESFVFVSDMFEDDKPSTEDPRIALDYNFFYYANNNDGNRIVDGIYNSWLFLTDTIGVRYGIESHLLPIP